MPEERYDEYRRSSDFIKEYIFPGGCVPSFSILTSAMSAGSTFWYSFLLGIPNGCFGISCQYISSCIL